MKGHSKSGDKRDTQIIELLGRNRLVSDLLRAGLEVAVPARDRGVDLVAYVDLVSNVKSFIARPIQMKAASAEHFSINKKYAKVSDLILAFVWHLDDPALAETYALTYSEAVAVGEQMGWTRTASWKRKGSYSTQRPGKAVLNPAAWMPWNYSGLLASLEARPDTLT